MTAITIYPTGQYPADPQKLQQCLNDGYSVITMAAVNEQGLPTDWNFGGFPIEVDFDNPLRTDLINFSLSQPDRFIYIYQNSVTIIGQILALGDSKGKQKRTTINGGCFLIGHGPERLLTRLDEAHNYPIDVGLQNLCFYNAPGYAIRTKNNRDTAISNCSIYDVVPAMGSPFSAQWFQVGITSSPMDEYESQVRVDEGEWYYIGCLDLTDNQALATTEPYLINYVPQLKGNMIVDGCTIDFNVPKNRPYESQSGFDMVHVGVYLKYTYTAFQLTNSYIGAPTCLKYDNYTPLGTIETRENLVENNYLEQRDSFAAVWTVCDFPLYARRLKTVFRDNQFVGGGKYTYMFLSDDANMAAVEFNSNNFDCGRQPYAPLLFYSRWRLNFENDYIDHVTALTGISPVNQMAFYKSGPFANRFSQQILIKSNNFRERGISSSGTWIVVLDGMTANPAIPNDYDRPCVGAKVTDNMYDATAPSIYLGKYTQNCEFTKNFGVYAVINIGVNNIIDCNSESNEQVAPTSWLKSHWPAAK